MGNEADDALRDLKLSDIDQCQYGFPSFFCGVTIMYKQEANNTVEVCVTALYALADHCNY